MSGKLWVATLVAWLLGTLVILGSVVLSGLFIGFPLKWCWNCVVPHITNGAVPEIGFWHALALWVIPNMLMRSITTSATKG
jgi:hypothetical protein